MGTMKGVSALSFLQHVLHREIPSSMFGCLSGGWSLVVGQLQTWPWGVQGVIFCLRGLRRFWFASGVSRYVLSGSTFYERFSGVDFVMWCIPDPRNFCSTLILARFNVFCSRENCPSVFYVWFQLFWHSVQAPAKNCCLRTFDSFWARLMGFCVRFACDFCTNVGAKRPVVFFFLIILHELSRQWKVLRIIKKCYNSQLSIYLCNEWRSRYVTTGFMFMDVNVNPGWLIPGASKTWFHLYIYIIYI